MRYDGDDDDNNKEEKTKKGDGDYSLPDDIGERVGEGHDPVEDSVT